MYIYYIKITEICRFYTHDQLYHYATHHPVHVFVFHSFFQKGSVVGVGFTFYLKIKVLLFAYLFYWISNFFVIQMYMHEDAGTFVSRGAGCSRGSVSVVKQFIVVQVATVRKFQRESTGQL